MGPLMYRQKPAFPALIGALAVIALGGFICWGLKERIDSGLTDSSSMILVLCLTGGIAGSLVIAAFARYQFTHLWKSTKARHSDVHKTRARSAYQKKKLKRAAS